MKKKNSQKTGRKTVMTKSVLGKLEQAFSLGCSDREACLYAGINPDTLYRYQRLNSEFSERKQMLKSNPVLKARQTIIDNLDKPKIAMWFLERRCKEEFSQKNIYMPENFNPELTDEEFEEIVALMEKNGLVDGEVAMVGKN